MSVCDTYKELQAMADDSFNPCFSGCRSAIFFCDVDVVRVDGFNPCFSGCRSAIPIVLSSLYNITTFQSLF